MGVTQNLTGANSDRGWRHVDHSIGTLTAGSKDVETIVVTPIAAAVPSTMNTVTVTGDNFDPNSLSTTPTNTVTTTTAVAPSSDLLVQLNQSLTSALVGQNLTYTIDVTNFGPSDATGVILTDTLPANTTVVSATSTVGAAPQVSGTTLTSNISALPNGQTAVITIVITPLTGAVPSITNTVSVASATTDPNTAEQLDEPHHERRRRLRPDVDGRPLGHERAGGPEPDLHLHRRQQRPQRCDHHGAHRPAADGHVVRQRHRDRGRGRGGRADRWSAAAWSPTSAP